MALVDSLVLGVLPLVPRPVMRRLSARYIAGEELEDALQRLEGLTQQGFRGILNLLGEHVDSEAAAAEVVAAFSRAAAELSRRSLPAYVSVKPTHVGLELSEELALESYRELARATAEAGVALRVEMEDHPTVDATLRIFEALRAEHGHVGIVLQARLLRTPDDIERLAPGPLNVRLVKGIYLEPASVAHTEPEPIRRAFVECARKLLDRDAFPALATHDGPLAEELFALLRERGLGPEDYEMQVLMGVQERLWRRWRADGHPVRVYVPYGPEWREYSLRRMRKNPEILRHVMRSVLGS